MDKLPKEKLREIKRRIFLNKQNQEIIERKNNDFREVLKQNGTSTAEGDND